MHVARSIEVKGPHQFVWQLVHDKQLRPRWDVRVSELTLHGEHVPGTQVTIAWRTPMFCCVSEAEVTAFDAPHRSAMAVDEASLPIFPLVNGSGHSARRNRAPASPRVSTSMRTPSTGLRAGWFAW